MQSETKTCQNCKKDFTIEAEDFAFYEKMNVPPPTGCPECREQRRLLFRNERTYYRGTCARCDASMVSLYAPGRDRVVYCQSCYYSDAWDPRDCGRSFDFSKTFTEQFGELLRVVPRVAMLNSRSENCEYTQFGTDNKDCYLLVQSSNSERVHYSYWMQKCIDCIDCSHGLELECCYACVSMERSYRCFYSINSQNCLESYFLVDCSDCQNCFGCINLRHKQYCIFNEQKTKEEYELFIKSQKLDTWEGIQNAKARAADFANSQPRRYAEIINAEQCIGNHITRAKGCRHVFGCYDAENCSYGTDILRQVRDCMDVNACVRECELVYDSIGTVVNAYHCRFTSMCRIGCSNLTYCDHCHGADECFGCVSLRPGMKFCILNKEYSEDEYYKLKDRVIEHMKQTGEWGIFFDPRLSSFGYNETNAQEDYPLSKEQARAYGYRWEEQQAGSYGKETAVTAMLSQHIGDVPQSITQEVLACGQCKKNYRIIKQEYDFYQAQGIPIPHICPDCRFAFRRTLWGPHKLWSRQCQCEGAASSDGIYANATSHAHGASRCAASFQTAYSPDRSDIVYCAECYQAETV